MKKEQIVVNREDYLDLQLKLHEANKALDKFKSLVKTVDPDNLPEEDVELLLYWNEIKEFDYIFFNKKIDLLFPMELLNT